MKRIGVIGSGIVANVLENGFLKNGYEVMMGTRSPEKLDEWKAEAGEKGHVGSFKETAAFGEIAVLSIKGHVAEEVVKDLKDELKGKTVIDPTNPIDDSVMPPPDGVLHFFTDMNYSLMERLQDAAPDVNFVKAFSCVGNHFMVDPKLQGGNTTMFICGNEEGAKSDVTTILKQFGWEYSDMGTAKAARAIEPLCILWCIPGFRSNQWSHAFALLNA